MSSPLAESNRLSPLFKLSRVSAATLDFAIIDVTPELAADWLKRNAKNRKVKEPTLDCYTRDMTNGNWLLTHQAIAFDEKGNLIDGQHRLFAIVRSRQTVRMFVTFGWPAVVGKKKTMDAVDRGTNRSIADQLKLQHDIKDAGPVVQVANSIVACCAGTHRVAKGSVSSVLYVVGLFPDEMKWFLESRATERGIRSAEVAGAMVLGRAVWPDKTSDFWTRLRTGENLPRGNPILALRNWLTNDGLSSDRAAVRNATLNCLKTFVEGRSIEKFGGGHVGSEEGRTAVLNALADRVKKICKAYQADIPKPMRQADAPTVKQQSHNATSGFSPEAIAVAATLPKYFSSLDLRARVDSENASGLWIAHWRQRGWIEPGAPGQFIKTEDFPKPSE